MYIYNKYVYIYIHLHILFFFFATYGFQSRGMLVFHKNKPAEWEVLLHIGKKNVEFLVV